MATDTPRDLDTLPAPAVADTAERGGVRRKVTGTFTFDGRTFPACWSVLHDLYLAARARRGDELAAELLYASGSIEIWDCEGRPYWPPGGDR